MQLNQYTRAMGLGLLLAGGVCLTACSDDAPSGTDSGVGVKDATTTTQMDATGGNGDATTNNPDATGPGPDGGMRDGGGMMNRDGGPMGTCMQGTEGCPCDGAMACQGGLTCYTWPFNEMDPAAVPVRTCGQPCAADMDCAANALGNNACRAFFSQEQLPEDATRPGICSKATATAGQACRGSRRPGNRDITGCGEDELCLTNQGPGGSQADEGVCGQLCVVSTSTPTGGCTAPTPYCNPDASGLVGTSTNGMMFGFGVCSAERIPIGALCDQDDITRGCDQAGTAEGVLCIGLPETADGTGVCTEFCRLSTGACQQNGTCVAAINNMTFGVCSAECEQSPDSCTGPGHAGGGRTCLGQYIFMMGLPGITICVDNQLPALQEVRLQDNMGQLAVLSGEPCEGTMGEALHCPDGTICADLGGNQTGCLRGCTTSTATMFTRGGCELNGNTSTVATCLDIDDTDMSPLGLCVEP